MKPYPTVPVTHEGKEYRQVVFPDYGPARQFLSLHHGSCSVPADSALGHAFAGLQVAGEVELRLSSTAGYLDVYEKKS